MAASYDAMKGWSHVAATRGEARLYDWAAAPDDRSLRRVDGFYAQGDYPPLSLYALGAAGRIYYRATGGAYPDTPALTATVKAPALVADIALLVLLFVVVRGSAGIRAARTTVLACWLNPALVLGTVHGLLDALLVLPVAGAVIAAAAGWPALAGSLCAAAVLTKPQGVLVVPVAALAIWNAAGTNRTSQLARAAGGAALAAAVILLPIVVAGAAWNMVLAVGSNALGGDMLSNACNLWWIVGHAIQVAQGPDAGVRSMLTTQAVLTPISAVMDFESPAVRIAVRVLGGTLTMAAGAWGVWTARRARDLWLHAGAAAFLVHAYVVLTPQVHENHLFAAVPLLALASAGRRRFLPLLVVVSIVAALNLNLLYGLGEPDLRYAIPRGLIGVDLMLLASAANCAALAWHALVLARESPGHPELS